MKTHYKEDQLSSVWMTLSNMLPPVGFILYYRHRKQFPHKARRALFAAIIGIPMAIIGGYIFNNYILP